LTDLDPVQCPAVRRGQQDGQHRLGRGPPPQVVDLGGRLGQRRDGVVGEGDRRIRAPERIEPVAAGTDHPPGAEPLDDLDRHPAGVPGDAQHQHRPTGRQPTARTSTTARSSSRGRAARTARSAAAPRPTGPPRPGSASCCPLDQFEIAAEHGLSLAQTQLLGVLRDREPLMSELGRHLGLDKSSISGLVDRAQRRGLVTRTASDVDRRAIRVPIGAGTATGWSPG
jgi:hypothetical protein